MASMSTEEVMTFLDCNRMTLSRLVKKHNLTKKKKGRFVTYIKKEIRAIASEVEANKQPSSVEAKETTPAAPVDSLVVADDAAGELYWDIVETFFPDGMDKFQESQAQTITLLTLQKSRVELEIVKDPLDLHLALQHQRIIKSINDSTKGLNLVSKK